MITDLLRNKLAAYLVTLINHTNAEGDVGLGGIVEIKLMVEGANITGKVIREASFGGNDGSTDEMLARVSFEGIGPFAANEQLEIFLTVEVE